MAAAIFLWISGVGWLLYGLFCFFQPAFLGDAGGVAPTNVTGLTEIRAMYGGLQTGMGALVLISALNPRWRPGVLLTLSCVYFGLCLARSAAAISAGDHTSYTVGALGFEWTSALLSSWLFRRTASRL